MPFAFRRLSTLLAVLLMLSSSGCAFTSTGVIETIAPVSQTSPPAAPPGWTPTARSTAAREPSGLAPSPSPAVSLETPASTPTRVSAASTPTPAVVLPTLTPHTSRLALPALEFDVLYLRQGSLYRWSHMSKQGEAIFGPTAPGLISYFQAETPLFAGAVIEFAADATQSRLVALVDRGVSANGVGLYDLLLIDLERGAARTLLSETRRLSGLLPSPDGSWLAYVNSGDGRLYLLSLASQSAPQDIAACRIESGGECNPAWSLSGKYLSWADSQGVWQAEPPGWQPVMASPLVISIADIDGSLRDVQVYARSLIWAPFDRYLLAEIAMAGGEQRWLAVVDMRTGAADEVPGVILAAEDSLPAAWFPDGRLITLRHETAASSGLVQAQIWQVLPTRQPMLTLQSSFELPLAAVEFDDLQIIANRFLLFRAWGEANLNGWLARLDLEFGEINWTLLLPGGVNHAVWAPDGSGVFLQAEPDIGMYAAAGGSELVDLRAWFGEELSRLTWCIATGKYSGGSSQ